MKDNSHYQETVGMNHAINVFMTQPILMTLTDILKRSPARRALEALDMKILLLETHENSPKN